jgi:phage terminase small subunit
MARHTQPDAVKALRGNPGKRKLMLDDGTVERRGTPVAIEVPPFLTHERERSIFLRIVDDYLQRRIARPVDFMAYGRWASYVHRWMTCKEEVDGKSTYYPQKSPHVTQLKRKPAFADMFDLERAMIALEDRLGLNPVARQAIIRGLAGMPVVFEEEQPPAEGEPPKETKPREMPADAGPLGYLQAAGKLN